MPLLLYILFFINAYAVEPTSPELRFLVGENATARSLPRVNPKVAEVIVRDCDRNLSSILEGLHSPQIRQIFALNTEENSWLLRIALRHEGLHVDAVVIRGGLELWVREDEEVLKIQPPFTAVPTVEELLTQTYEREEPFPPDLALRFLYGDALSYGFEPSEYRLEVCQPSDSANITRRDIDRARAQYLESESLGQSGLRERGDAAYKLGWSYMKLGHAQEASFYFSQLSLSPGSQSPLCIALANAQVALHKHKWDHFLVYLKNAYRYGGDDATIVEGIANLSLANGSPPRAVVGRLLANLTSRPESLLLSAELLQMDGFFDDSLLILQPLYDEQVFGHDPTLSKRLSLRLGDAYLVAGDFVTAKEVWRSASPEMSLIRNTHALMLEKGLEFWVQSIPVLSRIARNVNPDASMEARAEALYLMGQVDTIQGTRRMAMDSWKEFLKTFPKIAEKSDVGKKLWALYSLRVRALFERKQWTKIIETHERSWTHELKPYIEDPKVLIQVAEAYERLGLVEHAWSILNIGFVSLAENSQFTPELMLYLAELYGKIGHEEDGLSTLGILKNKPEAKDKLPTVNFLEGKLRLRMQDFEKAREAFSISQKNADLNVISRMYRGLTEAEAGLCEAAPAALGGLTFSEEAVLAVSDPHPFFALAPCFSSTDRTKAIKLVNMAKERSETQDEILRANYLLAEYENSTEVEVEETGKESIWGKLLQEKKDSYNFDQELESWRNKSK